MIHRASSLKHLIGAGGIVVLGLTATSLAQVPAPEQGRGMYNPKTETTIVGVVQSIDTIAAPSGGGRRSLGGTHLVVKTDRETLEVHLGPTAYLNEKKIAIAKGDSLEILGSRVTLQNEPILLARRIKKGQTEWSLRDATGRPLWSGRGGD
jgi:hypothetical protein